jgi:hypothetical protein
MADVTKDYDMCIHSYCMAWNVSKRQGVKSYVLLLNIFTL